MPVAWNEPQAAEIVRRHAGQEGALLPILHDLQATFRCIPPPAVSFVAHALNLTRAEVHGVVTFYHDFRSAPAGRRVLKLCRAEACQAMDGERIARRILDRFDLEWGDTTPDGRLTVEAVYCLGLCACAPAALLDEVPIGRLNEASPDELANEVGA
ncbi:formate dehydrogenase subunit gamma [Reyranella sp.]|jgi:formate dehydrogenase subunit gamma|uniref:formate dehydrogenase subunit gamma n=1 Tax=Reyranella sp. TaxID=1929291 RepID=UPI000BC7C3C7|nr:formate dehydrogenase subunit gamma [Reyranella sp.]OYY42650.1 MAG: formate dehydrogenase subunit gamma [Rhodospirillales bacterium 35-66-84]OYZ94404.1 MAG: formate dehydrogenase subunit gamma [Rhodospirillales bacterium 24-66-33]OZB25326.1 MAG: formate dehydrogenase subunit gamma [Rhodospirillales bacterium 39-66-50]HQS16484.1 formate dehydrogenase subunit gamma [Reyranella sp.]HQT13416.1 formate dehydrogenase subunit gamma [Reyranella sp.]